MPLLQPQHVTYKLLSPQTGILAETSYTLKQQSYKHITMLPW